MQGVGEAGSEAIIPLNNRTLGSIGRGISDTMSGGTVINNDNDIVINATIRNDKDIDLLAEKIDEKLNQRNSRRRASFGG